MATDSQPLHIALIGGGIAGLTLALGLVKRGVSVKLYEQAHNFKEIGAGVAFSPNSVRCMKAIDPRVADAFHHVACVNADPAKRNMYFQWVNGYHDDPHGSSDKLFKLVSDSPDVDGCHRAHFLDELVKILPEGVAEFEKHLDNVTEDQTSGKLVLGFHDGSTATADAVIGCDGIKSRVRQLIHGEDNPASYPHYSHKFAYRGLIPMDKAAAALGDERARNRHMYMGPDAHILTFPVSNGQIMNVVAFVHDPLGWPDAKRLTLPATKADAIKTFAHWGKDARSITELLDDKLDKWAIFDTWDYPLSTFFKGRLCVSGDAAHATSPHHGSGAGFCIEDSAVLSVLLEKVKTDVENRKGDQKERVKVLTAAFAAFDLNRRERTQWLVNSSRVVGDTYEWRNPHTCRSVQRCYEELDKRFKTIWEFDEQRALQQALDQYSKQLAP